MQRILQVRAVLEVGHGVHKRVVDPEEFHDKGEMKAGALPSSGLGLEGGDPAVCRASIKRLGRLTEYKSKSGDITSALAWDDLTGMRLDAGKVKEARSKEVQ